MALMTILEIPLHLFRLVASWWNADPERYYLPDWMEGVVNNYNNNDDDESLAETNLCDLGIGGWSPPKTTTTRKRPLVYLIGSLRNGGVPGLAAEMRDALDVDVFDDWHASGPKADDAWRTYEVARGRGYVEALDGPYAMSAYNLDHSWLSRCDAAVLILPAGRSCHLELGFVAGMHKPTFILLGPQSEKERWDIMYNFATAVVRTEEELFERMEPWLEYARWETFES